MDQTKFHEASPIFDDIDGYEKIRRLLDFENGRKLKILDAGSGAGLTDQRLRKLGHEVLELDIREAGRSGADFIKCDLNQPWPVAENAFDLVICTDVLEHVYEPQHYLRQSWRALKPDGRLIVSVLNHFGLRQRLKIFFGRGIVHWDHLQFGEEAWNTAHIRFFTFRDFEKFIKKNGWQIVGRQFNFMGDGIIPSRLAPEWLKKFLLQNFPGLFSGKFIVLLAKTAETEKATHFVLETVPGM